MEYGLIGERLGHSFSKTIHEALADYSYELKEIAPQELEGFLRARRFRAVNVTIPYKQAVIPFLDALDETAERIGAVNTIIHRGGRLIGYNTDYFGMKRLIERIGVSPASEKVAILGTGGTSKTAMTLVQDLGASQVVRLGRSTKEGCASYDCLDAYQDATLLINTTPVGMHPHQDGCPIDWSHVPSVKGVVDAVYHPLRTRLVQGAEQRGLPAEGGLYMLVWQAVAAASLFTGRTISQEEGDRVYRQIWTSKRNIVLIGMPSSGKTTLGRRLALAYGVPIIDTDEVIEREEGCSVAEYIQRQGIEAFRARETHLIESSLRYQTGCIIATGGGMILKEENCAMLKENGWLIWLDRPLERLIPTASRPLSGNREDLALRYAERRPLYRRAADRTVCLDGMQKADEHRLRAVIDALSMRPSPKKEGQHP